jgi:hypothetical protein
MVVGGKKGEYGNNDIGLVGKCDKLYFMASTG